MPLPTPFHPRTSKLCESLAWKEWGGYHAVKSYDICYEREYYAFRHAAGMIDVTPLFKYDIRGQDACAYLCRLMVRNIAKLKLHQVAYLCWTDDDGKIIDDGTVTHMDENWYRVTSTEPEMHWFLRHTRGFDVSVEDVTEQVAALSVQGPNSREVLRQASDADMDALKYFRMTPAKLDGGVECIISRTGYTGDLGYEIWVKNDDALKLWDGLLQAGKPLGLEPAGLDAMDVTRVEAGFILNGIDYYNALHTIIEPRKASPYELALGWTVHLKRDPFIGQEALVKEKQTGPPRVFVGLDIDWDELEALFARHGLPPEVHQGGWRDPKPLYDLNGQFIGQATSGAWSPLLKKNLALATVRADQGDLGNKVKFEVTVEYERKTVTATVVKKPFFDPERKKS
jgi:aminomethyltransferase